MKNSNDNSDGYVLLAWAFTKLAFYNYELMRW